MTEGPPPDGEVRHWHLGARSRSIESLWHRPNWSSTVPSAKGENVGWTILFEIMWIIPAAGKGGQ